MDKERGFEELFVPPVGISEAEEDKRNENSKGDIKQTATPIVSFPLLHQTVIPKKKTVTVFKKGK